MKKGFTLAEVLITLGIIGVVAALTIPILVNSYQKTQYETGLKKAYTEFNQALIKIAADNNCVGDLACTGIFDTNKTNQSLGTELVKYFKVIDNCETLTTGCMSDEVAWNYDGTGFNTSFLADAGGAYRFITADGIAFWIRSGQNNCGSVGSLNPGDHSAQICGEMFIDSNGPTKGPNNVGRDLFYFYITNGKGPLLYPQNGPETYSGLYDPDGNPTSCYSGDPNGFMCSSRVMQEGWKMNY